MPAPALGPLRQYFELSGAPLDDGYLYFGTAGGNPETSPITVFWDAAGTVPAAQPIRTKAGHASRSGSPAAVYANGSYSLKIKDKRGATVLYVPTVGDDLGALAASLLDRETPTKGAGMVAYSPTTAYAAGSTGHALKGWICPQDAPWNADNTGAADATRAIQDCIDYAKANTLGVDLRTGTYLTGPLSLNGSGYTGPANAQWSGVVAFKGGSRAFAQCVLRGKAGAFPNGKYLLTGRNLSGVYIGGFSIDGDGKADCGLDLEWVGGSAGNALIAPSCSNVIEQIFVDGCATQAIKLDQMNDSQIRGLWVRGVMPGNFALFANGGGGQMMLDGCWIAIGKVQLSAQNGSAVNCGFFGGVEIAGGTYNNWLFASCHFYPSWNTGACIDSVGIGNSSRSLVLLNCYANIDQAVGQPAAHLFGGRFWQGARIIGGQSNCPVFGTIGPAAGTGSLPLFSFEHHSFEHSAPATTENQYRVKLEACRSPTGSLVSSDDAMVFTPAWSSSGKQPVIGNGSIVGRSVRTGQGVRFESTLTIGSTTTLGTGAYSFSVPLSIATPTAILGDCLVSDASASQTYSGLVVGNSPGTVGVVSSAGVQMSGSAPVELATGDTITLSIGYITNAP